MSDLISRSALIEKLEEKMFDSKLMCPVIKLTNLIELIDEQPTAYDVDKVVAELENMKLIRVEQCYGDYEIEVMTNNNFVDAIDIVRKGGVE